MIIFLVLLVIINVIFNLNNLINSINNSFIIWYKNILPSVFIFYIIGNILISKLNFLKKESFIKKILYFDSNKSYYIFFTSIFLANPSSTNIINKSYENNEISQRDFHKLISICNFINPMFILSFSSKNFYFLYLISILITSILFTHKFKNYNSLYKDSSNKSFNFKYFKQMINDLINILLNIICIILVFNILKTSIEFTLSFFNISIPYLLSFIEVSTSIKYIYNNYNIFYSFFILSFQGLCIILQSYFIINEKNISFTKYVLIHFIFSIISLLFFSLLFFVYSNLCTTSCIIF